MHMLIRITSIYLASLGVREKIIKLLGHDVALQERERERRDDIYE